MKLPHLPSLVVFLCCFVAAPIFAAGDVATQFDKPPTPLRTPPPEFPESKKGSEGIVSLLVVINADGSVAEASVAKSSDAAFEAPSLEAIAKWKFKPAEINGQPVRCKITIPIRFTS